MGKITITAKTQIENLETTVTVDEEATIGDLIRKVAPIFGFNPEHSVIMFRGEEIPPIQTLKEADIQDGFAVLVLPQKLPKLITVNVKNVLAGQRTSVRIESYATVHNVLEEAVSESALDTKGIVPMYREKTLSLGQTLEEAGIKDGSTIVLVPQMERSPESRPQVSQPRQGILPTTSLTTGIKTITPADEKLLREMLGEYKRKYDSLGLRIKNCFLIPKKVAYFFIVVAVISVILVFLWPYLRESMRQIPGKTYLEQLFLHSTIPQ